jgi:Right handed beta helix region
MPNASGARGRPITFTSYGGGRARISNAKGAVWFSGKSYLRFRKLNLTTGGAPAVIFAGSSSGSSHITVQGCVLENSAYTAINSPTSADSGWRIVRNVVRHIGDSGMIIQGSRFLIGWNSIRDTGLNPDLDYGKHGIYSKGPGVRIWWNTIKHFEGGSGITLRFHSAVVAHNVISSGSYGVSYFADDPVAKTSYVRENTVTDVSKAGFFYGDDGEHFVVRGNRFQMTGGAAFDVKAAQSAKVTIAGNMVRGTFDYALIAAPRARGLFREHHNRFSGMPTFVWDGASLPLLAYRAASGEGVGDVVGL